MIKALAAALLALTWVCGECGAVNSNDIDVCTGCGPS